MSEEVAIPGGTAVLLNKAAELSPRRRRPVEIVSSRIGKKLDPISTATRLLIDGDVVLDQSDVKDDDGELVYRGGDVEVSERELGLIMRLNDVMALALLQSWTIEHPLPRTEDEFAEIPIEVYDALRAHAARINKAMRDGGFTVDSVEDPTSPIGD